MNENIEGNIAIVMGMVVFVLPLLFGDDPAILTVMLTSLCSFCSILAVFAGVIMRFGGPSNKDRIDDLEKRVETLEER